MNKSGWSDTYHDDTDHDTGPISLVFFPDMSEFEEQKTDGVEEENNEEISEWALKKIGTLQSRLEVMQNARESKKYHGSYTFQGFSSHVIFNLANETFGYDGWSSEIISSSLVHEDLSEESQEYSVTYCVVVRVILKDGTYKDELGTGEVKNLPHKHMCYNMGKKQAITDGLKNAILGLRDLLVEHELKHLAKPKTEKGIE